MAKRVIGRKSCVTILLCGGLYSLNVGAAVEGEITPVGGPKMYNIDVANQDITNNSPGATIPYVFSTGWTIFWGCQLYDSDGKSGYILLGYRINTAAGKYTGVFKTQ